MVIPLGSIVGAGINLVANGIGSYYANKQKKEAEAAYKEEQEKLLGEINEDLNTNFLDRADSRNALRKLTDSNTEAMRQLNTGAIRGGATDEAKVAMASQLNKRTADVVGDIAALGEQRKDSLKQQKRSLLSNMALHRYQQDSDTSGWNTLLQGIGSAATSLGSAWDNARLEDANAANNIIGLKNTMATQLHRGGSKTTIVDGENKYEHGNSYGNKGAW